jgi:hypothetical protein
MARRLVSLTLDNVDELPSPCRSCAFWELGDRSCGAGAKDEWLSAVLLESGRCGTILYVDGDVAGYALYAPPEFVEGRLGFGTAPISDDAIVLMTARILPEYSAAGLGRILIQSVVKDTLSRRGIKALEAYGDVRAEPDGCVIPAEFLTAVGFKTKNRHPRYPLHRLELRSVLRWKPELEVALERWLDAIRPEKAAGPVGASPRTDVPPEIATETP